MQTHANGKHPGLRPVPVPWGEDLIATHVAQILKGSGTVTFPLDNKKRSLHRELTGRAENTNTQMTQSDEKCVCHLTEWSRTLKEQVRAWRTTLVHYVYMQSNSSQLDGHDTLDRNVWRSIHPFNCMVDPNIKNG